MPLTIVPSEFMPTGPVTFTGDVGIGVAPTTDFHILGKNADLTTSILVQTDDTANAVASLQLYSRDGSNINKTASFANNAGDLALSTNSVTDALVLNASTGAATFSSNVVLTGGSATPGSIWKSGANTLVSMDTGGFYINNSADTVSVLTITDAGAATFSGDLLVQSPALAGVKISSNINSYLDSTDDNLNANIFVTGGSAGDFSSEVGHLVLQARVQGGVYRDIIFAGGLSTSAELLRLTGEGTATFSGNVTADQSGGSVTLNENGGADYTQKLDLATAGMRLRSYSNRGYLGYVDLNQEVTSVDGGQFRVFLSPSGTTTPANVLNISSTGAATFSGNSVYIGPYGSASIANKDGITITTTDLGANTGQAGVFLSAPYGGGTTNSGHFRTMRGSGSTYIGTEISSTGAFRILTNSSSENSNEAMRIDTSGNLMTGTTNASIGGVLARLGISVSAGNSFIINNSESIADGQQAGIITRGVVSAVPRTASMSVYKHAGITNAAAYLTLTPQDGASNFYWTDDSDIFRTSQTATHVGTTSGTVVGTQTSDERIKVIEPDFEYGLAEIIQLVPIAYSMKDDPIAVRKLGFGAQTTRPILPELVYDTGNCVDGYVQDSDDPMIQTPLSADTKLAMEYVQMIPVLVKAMQEQQEMIVELQAQVAALQQQSGA